MTIKLFTQIMILDGLLTHNVVIISGPSKKRSARYEPLEGAAEHIMPHRWEAGLVFESPLRDAEGRSRG